MAELITSEHNPLLKDVRRAASRGALTSDGCALAEGLHLLEEALASGLTIEAVITAEQATSAVEAILSRKKTRLISISEKLFGTLSSIETPQGVLALVRLKAWELLDLQNSPNPLLVVLDGLQDPGNAGAVVRSAEAFGATGVIFLKNSVHAHNPKCLRSSAGSLFRVPVVERAEAGVVADLLKSAGARIFAAMPRAEITLDCADLSKACALVIGSEAHGVSSTMQSASVSIRIPTTGVESLNAAAAAAVMLYEAQRQRRAA